MSEYRAEGRLLPLHGVILRGLAGLLDAPRWVKRAVMMVTDELALAGALWCAYALRFNTLHPKLAEPWLFGAAMLLSVGCLYGFGFYRYIVRFLGAEAAWSIVAGMSAALVGLAGVTYLLYDQLPRSVLLIFWLLSVIYLGGSRFLVRRLLFRLMSEPLDAEPVAVFGAGAAGAQLIAALRTSREVNPVLVVDDDPGKEGVRLCGLPVVGRAALRRAVEKGRLDTVLLAMPSLARRSRLELVRWLEGLDVRVRTVPTFDDIASGRARVDDIKDVSIEDLLGRDTVAPDPELLHRCITGKSVLVTGAGGSIGSELCRQILKLAPARLVLLEQSEVALYGIERELRDLAGTVELVAMLGSVVNRGLVERLCRQNGVQTLYHAAAYKHVPIVESNPAAGVRNNIIGTLAAAEGARAAGVDHFILVSTDKAVRPTNVMGATKRFAELVLQSLAEQQCGGTVFSMVRFGNVLGSSGSVVPLFRDQIRKGGPVTVTHPDVIRYFMTIPEASQLVIQAGAMACGGEVFLLDMGEPVRICDLAHAMIRQMGLSVRDEQTPDGDIEIRFTGLRPGEKLYEELLIGENGTQTRHAMIMQAHEEKLSAEEVAEALEAFRGALDGNDNEALRRLLRTYVSGYQPRGAGDPLPQHRPAREIRSTPGDGAAWHVPASSL